MKNLTKLTLKPTHFSWCHKCKYCSYKLHIPWFLSQACRNEHGNKLSVCTDGIIQCLHVARSGQCWFIKRFQWRVMHFEVWWSYRQQEEVFALGFFLFSIITADNWRSSRNEIELPSLIKESKSSRNSSQWILSSSQFRPIHSKYNWLISVLYEALF